MKRNRISILGLVAATAMFAKDTGGGNGGGGGAKGTGTGTGTAAKTDTKPKAEVTTHPKLLTLVKQLDAATEKAGTLLVEVGELVLRDNISNPVLIKTLMEARGVTEASAKSQASRIRSLLKDKESFEALKRGDVTVRAAVKGAQARRAPSATNNAKAFDAAVNKLVTAAKAVGQDKKTIMTTIEAALDKGGVK
jgi:hypothetical protein